MSKFLSSLCVVEVDEKNWRLYEPFRYESDVAKCCIEVPAGFVTDFASFRVGPFHLDAGTKAAVIHDYGYRTPGVMSKKMIDKVFLEAMKLDGVPMYRRQYMYWAVRLFGGSSYKGGVK